MELDKIVSEFRMETYEMLISSGHLTIVFENMDDEFKTKYPEAQQKILPIKTPETYDKRYALKLIDNTQEEYCLNKWIAICEKSFPNITSNGDIEVFQELYDQIRVVILLLDSEMSHMTAHSSTAFVRYSLADYIQNS